jgi:hypothetical protein
VLVLAVGLAIGSATLVSLHETGAMLSRETWAAGINWIAGNARLLPASVSTRRAGLVAVVLAWMVAPLVLAIAFDRLARVRTSLIRLALPLALGIVVIASAVAAPRAILDIRGPGGPARGFWRSAVSAWFSP